MVAADKKVCLTLDISQRDEAFFMIRWFCCWHCKATKNTVMRVWNRCTLLNIERQTLCRDLWSVKAIMHHVFTHLVLRLWIVAPPLTAAETYIRANAHVGFAATNVLKDLCSPRATFVVFLHLALFHVTNDTKDEKRRPTVPTRWTRFVCVLTNSLSMSSAFILTDSHRGPTISWAQTTSVARNQEFVCLHVDATCWNLSLQSIQRTASVEGRSHGKTAPRTSHDVPFTVTLRSRGSGSQERDMLTTHWNHKRETTNQTHETSILESGGRILLKPKSINFKWWDRLTCKSQGTHSN